MTHGLQILGSQHCFVLAVMSSAIGGEAPDGQFGCKTV